MKYCFSLILTILIIMPGCKQPPAPIDRQALVTRHNIENNSIDSLNCLSVGNGEFTFTVDATGLQTFPAFHEHGIPLGTMSNWGWHTGENPENYSLSDVYVPYDVHGRQVDYVHQFRPMPGPDMRKGLATEWLRANPHRAHLGIVGLYMTRTDGSEVMVTDIKDNNQKLNLWTGEIESSFSVDGVPVRVFTVCHPSRDQVSARIESELLTARRLKIKIHFPFATPMATGYDFSRPDGHFTEMSQAGDSATIFSRRQDKDRYYVKVLHPGASVTGDGRHLWFIEPAGGSGSFEFSCWFSSDSITAEPDDFRTTAVASAESWKSFWSTGGAVDFSACTDPRAFELERRVVLSQYLTRIQCSGSLPPAETGLTYNSWNGKFHLEMHWWHGVHYALWQRQDILERQMEYYGRIYENARQTALHQGYKGVRWPKMVGPDGRESPSTVGTYLIWQQPHYIFFAELLYKNSGDSPEVLERYKKLVYETADFMASYAWYDAAADRYVLGPVLIPAQESLAKETTINPVFELVYWHWALKTAVEWKKRAGEEADPLWTAVSEKISKLPVLDGVYLCSENTTDSYTNPRYMSDHPIVSGIKGVMPPTDLVDDRILANSLDTIVKKWNWDSTWGWDFPMLAMSAASVGRPAQAIDFLLMDAPKNRYLLNGHNYQDAGRLSIYLPGNGGLLTAVAAMCVRDQFPDDGTWNVRWENLNSYVE